MKDCNLPAYPFIEDMGNGHFDVHYGLSKNEYAKIHITAAMMTNPEYTLSLGQLARKEHTTFDKQLQKSVEAVVEGI